MKAHSRRESSDDDIGSEQEKGERDGKKNMKSSVVTKVIQKENVIERMYLPKKNYRYQEVFKSVKDMPIGENEIKSVCFSERWVKSVLLPRIRELFPSTQLQAVAIAEDLETVLLCTGSAERVHPKIIGIANLEVRGVRSNSLKNSEKYKPGIPVYGVMKFLNKDLYNFIERKQLQQQNHQQDKEEEEQQQRIQQRDNFVVDENQKQILNRIEEKQIIQQSSSSDNRNLFATNERLSPATATQNISSATNSCVSNSAQNLLYQVRQMSQKDCKIIDTQECTKNLNSNTINVNISSSSGFKPYKILCKGECQTQACVCDKKQLSETVNKQPQQYQQQFQQQLFNLNSSFKQTLAACQIAQQAQQQQQYPAQQLPHQNNSIKQKHARRSFSAATNFLMAFLQNHTMNKLQQEIQQLYENGASQSSVSEQINTGLMDMANKDNDYYCGFNDVLGDINLFAVNLIHTDSEKIIAQAQVQSLASDVVPNCPSLQMTGGGNQQKQPKSEKQEQQTLVVCSLTVVPAFRRQNLSYELFKCIRDFWDNPQIELYDSVEWSMLDQAKRHGKARNQVIKKSLYSKMGLQASGWSHDKASARDTNKFMVRYSGKIDPGKLKRSQLDIDGKLGVVLKPYYVSTNEGSTLYSNIHKMSTH